jgi:4-amino-4-deoxy-L-arabinose transferase-like glycosyltransferase
MIASKINKSLLFKMLFRLILFAGVILVLFSRVISAGISHDEYQFIASSQVLVRYGQLPYISYPFLHMPYQVLVNGLPVLLSSYHVLAARCLYAIFDLGSALVLFYLVTKRFGEQPPLHRNLAGTLAVLLFLFDPSLMSMGERAINHSVPIMLSVFAFAIFQRGITKDPPYLHLLACGVLSGLATGVRLSFAVLVVPFSIVLLFYPKLLPIAGKFNRIASYIAGLLLSLFPVFILAIKAPSEFYFGNYLYIRLNTLYRQEVMFQESMTPAAKIVYFYENVLAHPASCLLYVGLVAVSLCLFIRLVKGNLHHQVFPLLSVLLSLVLLASSFAPTPLWPQYFFAPAPFLILSVFAGLSLLPRPSLRLAALILVMAIFIAGFPFQETTQRLQAITMPSQWIPVQVHQFARELQKIVPRGKVLTLAPIYPLEAGLETYPQFVVGPFVWRTAPLLSAQARANYGLISFHELEPFLNADPPAAILAGFETDYGFDAASYGSLELPFINYAKQNHYQPYKSQELKFLPSNITIWVRPQNPQE